ncbi:MAG: hypothetical protein WKF75_01825 [Singulisphaera sp.]
MRPGGPSRSPDDRPGPGPPDDFVRPGLLGGGPRHTARGHGGGFDLGGGGAYALIDGNADGCFDAAGTDRVWSTSTATAGSTRSRSSSRSAP